MGDKIIFEGFVKTLADCGDKVSEALLYATVIESRAVSTDFKFAGDWFDRQKPKPRECYYNAQKFALHHNVVEYYEGYWYTDIGFPVWHGWNMIDGKIVDLTAEALVKSKLSAFSVGGLYLGLHIPSDYVNLATLRTMKWSPILAYHLGLMPLPDGKQPAKRKSRNKK